MPRYSPAGSAGVVFHVVNRAVQGQLLFQDFGEYLAFRPLFVHALEIVPIQVFAYCLMPNHVHLLLSPSVDGQLGAFMKRLTSRHAQSLRRWRGTEGRGAMYQARFRASAVDNEDYFYTVARYIERNPVRAGLARQAEDWLWSSASPSGAMHGVELAEWPVPKPRNWHTILQDTESDKTLDFLRTRTRRGLPISDKAPNEPISAMVPVRRRAESAND